MIKKVSRAELNSSLENLKDVLGYPNNPSQNFDGVSWSHRAGPAKGCSHDQTVRKITSLIKRKRIISRKGTYENQKKKFHYVRLRRSAVMHHSMRSFRPISGRWESFRESIFSVFYIMTEQNEQLTGPKAWRLFRRTLIYLLDLGQVLRAIIRPEFGWASGIVGSMNNLDFVEFLVNVVCYLHLHSLQFCQIFKIDLLFGSFLILIFQNIFYT